MYLYIVYSTYTYTVHSMQTVKSITYNFRSILQMLSSVHILRYIGILTHLPCKFDILRILSVYNIGMLDDGFSSRRPHRRPT